MRTRGLSAFFTSLIGLSLVASGPASAAGGPAARVPRAPAAPAAILAQPGNAFIHADNIANTEVDTTYLDDPALNNHPSTRFLATMQLGAEGTAAVRDNHPIQLTYNSLAQVWGIKNADLGSMPDNTTWNVFVPHQDDSVISVTTSGGNISGSHVTLDNPLFNGDPNALLFVTPYWPPPGVGSLFTHTLAVAYNSGQGKWWIMTADGSPMPAGAGFAVLKPSGTAAAFTTVSSAANHLRPDATAIDNPLTNGNPDALILVTQDYDGGGTKKANNHYPGVWYDTTTERWLIFNQDAAAMEDGVAFNVLVIPPKQGFQLQTQGSVANYKSEINNPDLDGNPYARIYVMHNWNPPESDNMIIDRHPIGVFFDTTDQHWYLYNRDFATIAPNTTFNLYYTWPRGNSFTISADAFNTTTVTGMTLNSPLLNNHAGAVAIASYTKYPNGVYGGDYSSQVGALYGLDTFWHLFNTGGPAFPLYLSYNVLAPASQSFVVVADTGPSGNAANNDLVIDNPLTNDDPWAMLFVTPRGTPTIDEHPLGVYYTGFGWGIFNEDGGTIMNGQSFNVFVVKRHYANLPLIRK